VLVYCVITSQTPSARGALLRNRSVMLFWFARMSSTVAYQMLSVAVGWQIYALTRSPLYLGLVGLAQFLPMFLLTLVVGHVADRYDRRLVLRLCQFIEGFGTLLLAVGSYSGLVTKEGILVVVFILGAARAFENPTLHSLLPNLVTSELLPRAVAFATSSGQTAAIMGPALGGFLYAAHPTVAYAAAGMLFLGAGLFICLIRSGQAPPKRDPISVRSVFAGIAFIKSKPEILGAISLDLFAVLLGGATALLPVYAREILAVGPWGLGVLRSAPAAGALMMSIYLAHYPLKRRMGRTMFVTVIIFGFATIGFGLSTSLGLSLAALAILGSADVISVVIRQSLVQTKTPDPMRGRVNAVNSMFIGTSNQLGEFESGLTAAWFGVVPAVLIGGIGTIIVALVWMRLFPELAHTDSL
jgi:MFS family permease